MNSDFISEPKGVLALFFPFTLHLHGLKVNVTPNFLMPSASGGEERMCLPSICSLPLWDEQEQVSWELE